MGTALEEVWGDARYTFYILIACLSTVAFAFAMPSAQLTNEYIFGSVFLAFAYLFPDFVIYLFFVIPVKIKYVAAFTWLIYLVQFIIGDWGARLSILASVTNFLLFFGGSIIGHAQMARHGVEAAAKKVREENTPFHICAICKVTEKKEPGMEFRVCTLCKGAPDYCALHLRDHAHV